MSGPAPTADFFISYTGVDVKWARWLAQQLEAAGYTTIYQERDFHAGGNFIVQMHRALQSTRRTIAVLTPEYLRSRFTLPEWAEALRRDPTGEYALLVPVHVKPCELEGLLGARVYIDLVGLRGEVARQRLVEQVKREDSKPPPPEPFPGEEEAAHVRPSVVAPTGLPLAASLIGREEVLTELLDHLRQGTTLGVFALSGMGGVGKSALAAEAVARLAEDQAAFPGGAAWIACEGLSGEAGLADLWTRVATALGLERVKALTDPQARRAALAQALVQGKRRLLALDNMEPGLEAEAALETLAVRGHTVLLLTARHKVAPLKLKAIELAPLPPTAAQTLLVERLQQVDASRPTAAETPALPALLEALGGLPLALEVTAAYAGIQRRTLVQVLSEVQTDGLSAAALRADPKRAPLVRFERSWQVLSARQQRLFAGFSLQAGASFPREAARALAGATGDKKRANKAASDPAGDLGTLVSYTLLEALPGGERLRLHPLLREFAERKLSLLAQAERERLGDALVAHWLAYARAHPGYAGMDALEAEAEGLMGALAWAHAQARNQEVLGLTHALHRFWLVRGREGDAQRAVPWVQEAATALGDLSQERWALHELAEWDYKRGRLEEMRSHTETALKLAHQLGDRAAEREEVHNLAVLDHQTGRLVEARAGYEQALALARQVGDPAAEREEVHSLAVLDGQTGRLVEARAGYERALALARQVGDPAAEREEVHGLAVRDAKTGRLVEARAGYERALALARQLGDRASEREEVHSLAVLEAQMGRLSEARAGYERALALARQLGDRASERDEVHGLAVLDYQTGRLSEARAGFERALALARQVGDPAAEANELRDLGSFLGQTGEPERGRKMMMQGLALFRHLNALLEMGWCYQRLAWLERDAGNTTGAVAHFREALRCFEQVQSPDAEQVRAALRRLGG
jgi:tetratricopeptide (TPR) repeat protein